ncbi:MAG: hypothetical protein AAGE84_04640 [Cyanobacteria bacterium P01_G01_bin.39]
MGIAGLIFLLWMFSRVSDWNKLAENYKIEKCFPSIFVKNQQVTFQNSNNFVATVIRPLNIEISDEGIYFFKSSLKDIFSLSSLIPWSEIEYQPSYNDKYIFYMGNPVITCLRIYTNTIKKLEQEYGKPIFSNKLGEIN